MNELTHLDLFSGIGGFALAAKWAGFRTVGFSEIEPEACQTLAAEWPEVPNLGDIRNGDFSRFHSVTVVTGGFPCQPWSRAGDKRGTGDDRHLWPAMLRVIEIVRPTWIVGENVYDIIDLGGADLVISDLANIGYDCQPLGIPASAAGAGHQRKRVWFLAHAGGTRRPRPVPHERSLGGQKQAHSKPHDPILGTWDQLGRCARGVRKGNGVSLTMARAAIKGFGNAIVPQVVEPFFLWIAQIEKGEIA